MKTIFTVTAISSIEGINRIFGYFAELAKAKMVVESNYGDLHECRYDFLVIEEVPEGIIHPISNREYWYKFTDKWETIDKPFCYENVFNFGIG